MKDELSSQIERAQANFTPGIMLQEQKNMESLLMGLHHKQDEQAQEMGILK